MIRTTARTLWSIARLAFEMARNASPLSWVDYLLGVVAIVVLADNVWQVIAVCYLLFSTEVKGIVSCARMIREHLSLLPCQRIEHEVEDAAAA